jgi:GT2 family glycosyltransferase
MARNLGAQSAAGDILFFIDSDVCVHPDTVERVQSCLDANPGVSAVIGSYDDTPGAKDFISTYRNLMHCYVHQRAREEACTFWSGCGAIRRDVFLQHSGFDASYGRPAIEDIELGYRLRRARLKILLDKQLQVKHLKRWTFWNLIKTDIFDRGIPWTELILRDRSMPNDLNLQLSQRVSVALMFLMLGAAAALAVYWQGYFLTLRWCTRCSV